MADRIDFATAVGALIKGRAGFPAERINFVTNGAFETDLSGWNVSRATLTRDTTRAATGSASLKATVTAAGSSYAYTTTSTGLTPGEVLTIGFSLWDDTATLADSWVQFQDDTGAAVQTTPYVSSTITPGQWNRVVLTFPIPDGAARAQLLLAATPRTTGDAFWVDAVTAESMPFATSATPFTTPQRMSVWEAIEFATVREQAETATDPLAGWHQALTLRNGRPLNVLAVGDSITEGTGASTLASRWINAFQTHLRNSYGLTQGAEFPFIPAKYVTTAPGQPVVSSGNVTDNTTTGLGWRAVDIRDDTGQVTFTFTGTSAAVVISKASGTGIMSVTVDDGTPVTYDTNSANGGGSGAFLWPVPGIPARGVHTVTIRRDPATTTGRTILLHGLTTWDGDEAKGLRVHDAGHHGWGYTATNQARIDSLGVTLASVVKPDLIISAFGTNDIGKDDPAGYRASAQAYLDEYHAHAPGVPVLLVHMYRIQAHTEAQNAAYRAVLAELAAADPLVKFVDLRRHMPDVPTPHDAVPSQGLYAEGIHPNDYGHARIADAITGILA